MVGGSDPSEGRVELFYEGKWAGVAILPPDAAVADVACRQVGYPYSEGLQSFELGSGPVWLAIYRCTRDVVRVEQCWHSDWRYIYSSYPDPGVRCRGKY